MPVDEGILESSGAIAEVAQVEFNQHLAETGHPPEKLPAAVTHVGDAVREDDCEGEGHFPTDAERATLRRVPEKINFAVFAIGVCELAERFSFYGATQVFTNFIANPLPKVNGRISRTGAAMHENRSGALGLGSVTANGIVTFNQFWSYITPLFGGWLADVHLGRYNTLCVGVALAMVGHILLLVSALPTVLEDAQGGVACFIIAIIIMGLGTGMFKSNCSVMIVEQSRYNDQTVVRLKSGERVIIDPALTMARLYLWFYLMINIGSFCGELGMVFAEKWVGFWLAYLLPTLVFIIPIPVLWFGRKYYVKSPPNGSVLTQAVKAWVLAARKNWSWNPVTFTRRCRSSGFWDAVKPSNVPDSELRPWMTYSDQWIDELSRGIKACAIFILFPFYWLCYNQIINNLIIQANQMDLAGLPSEIVAVLDPMFIIVFVFIFNLGLYPLMDYLRVPLTPVKRITIGFFFASSAMIWAAVLQHYIHETNPCGNHVGDPVTLNGIDCSEVVSSLNVWIQAGSYVLMAISELFASVTSLEIAVLMAPKNMRSIVMSVGLFTTAVAAAIGEAFSPLSQNPNFIINYAIFAGLAFFGGLLFYPIFRSVDRRQEELNLITQDGYHKQQGHDAPSAGPGAEPPATEQISDKPVTSDETAVQ
ncbi:hypothetical protein MSPP1_002909 [Malassezia sp. CBS 17886]|nr:hypothetical protein MSPP1_002909 [Malassezia sp. CBS 17886]